MRTITALVAILVTATVFAADGVWKWKDAAGVTHYSDQPVPGAERVDLKVQTFKAPNSDVSAGGQNSNRQTASAPAYRSLEIWKPASQETVSNSGGQVSVRLRADPQLAAGDAIALYLDGQKVEGAPQALEYELSNIARGIHTLTAAIVTNRGQTAIESSTVTFNVLQASSAQPPVGPAIRPKR
jgi:hypothetical protein